jgi:hypothetical protein
MHYTSGHEIIIFNNRGVENTTVMEDGLSMGGYCYAFVVNYECQTYL